MSGTPAFSRPVLRSIHRAALVTLSFAFAASIDAGAPAAQGASRPDARGMPPNRMAFRMGMRGRHTMMMADPAARLLDEQSVLQLSGAQVSQLIALHESTRKQMRAITDRMRALVPRAQGRTEGQTGGQTGGRTQPGRPRISASVRDSLASLVDALRTARWRATSAADSVLTTDQRRTAVRMAMARRARMPGGWAGGEGFGGRGFGGPAFGGPGGMRRMAPGGMRTPRAPNDSGPRDD